MHKSDYNTATTTLALPNAVVMSGKSWTPNSKLIQADSAAVSLGATKTNWQNQHVNFNFHVRQCFSYEFRT